MIQGYSVLCERFFWSEKESYTGLHIMIRKSQSSQFARTISFFGTKHDRSISCQDTEMDCWACANRDPEAARSDQGKHAALQLFTFLKLNLFQFATIVATCQIRPKFPSKVFHESRNPKSREQRLALTVKHVHQCTWNWQLLDQRQALDPLLVLTRWLLYLSDPK